MADKRMYGHHGMTHARGCPHLSLGKFGKLCKDAPALEVGEEAAAALGGDGGIMHDVDDASKPSQLPAGYTFFAQFIDHDITLDTGSSLDDNPHSPQEIAELANIRSPSLDLDCVYSFGPEASPFLFDPEAPGRLLVGTDQNPNDVPRNDAGRALIGDPRNDENIFVSQLQLLFLRFHNRVLDGLVATTTAEKRFEDAQRIVRHHYQYLVLHDFLARICDPDVFQFALDEAKKHDGKYPFLLETDAHGRVIMPVEFSVAAYRFGHSLVRSRYAVNSKYPDIELFDERFSTLGFGGVPPELTIDWRYLLELDPACQPPLRSKKFDHLLADELIRLPDPVVGRRTGDLQRSLAFRNLRRGHVLSLPSGQDVVKCLNKAGYKLPKVDLDFDNIPRWKDLDSKLRKKLEKETPLFFYILREAGVSKASGGGDGERLGPAGSAILLEVFLGMLLLCKDSFLKIKDWQPKKCIAVNGADNFELADVVRYVEGH